MSPMPRVTSAPLAGIIAIALTAAATLMIGCITRTPLVVDEGEIRTAQDVDTERLRLRLDADGDDRLDVDLPITPMTFDHSARVIPFFEQFGLTALHENMDLDTGGVFTIPAGHTLSCVFDLLLSDAAMRAHGLLVLEQAADAAGIPEAPDLPDDEEPDENGDTDDNGDDDDGDSQPTTGPCTIAGADPTEGQTAYTSCGGCHGADGTGASAPSLVAEDATAALESTLGGGATHFGQTLTEEQIQDIACWLSTLQ